MSNGTKKSIVNSGMVSTLTWDACRLCKHTPDIGPCQRRKNLQVTFAGAGGVLCRDYRLAKEEGVPKPCKDAADLCACCDKPATIFSEGRDAWVCADCALEGEAKKMGVALVETADEKLAALREQYPQYDLYVRHVSRQWYPEDTPLAERGGVEACKIAARIRYPGPSQGVVVTEETEGEALDALAEALAKLEGKCPKCGGGMSCRRCDDHWGV